MKTPRLLVCGLALAALCGLARETAAQSVPNGNGVGQNNASGAYGVNPGGQVARVAVAPNLNTGICGLRHVTIQTPMIRQQQIARQHFIAGGVRLNGPRTNGTNPARGAQRLGP